MKLKQCILVIVILMPSFFSQTQALAEFYSGNQLVKGMEVNDKADKKIEDYMEANAYIGYVTGVYDATRHLYDVSKVDDVKQVLAVVGNYLKKHPEKWSESAVVLVTQALQEAFPFKKKSRKR